MPAAVGHIVDTGTAVLARMLGEGIVSQSMPRRAVNRRRKTVLGDTYSTNR